MWLYEELRGLKYFWSDVHFSHRGILGFCPSTRPFKDTDEMDAAIVERWNRRVKNTDDIYFLGDFSFEKDPATSFSRLHGRKHLIVGNHDRERKKTMSLPWESIHDLYTVRENGMRAVLCHFPISSWHNQHHGYLHFHGHTHGNLKEQIPHRFDVGFDVFPDGPISFEELGEMAKAQVFSPVDHHGAD